MFSCLPMSLRIYIKQSFHVFGRVLKTFEKDKRFGFASTFVTFSCFHIMSKHTETRSRLEPRETVKCVHIQCFWWFSNV